MGDQGTTTQQPDEGFLHSLATALGLDPEAVKQTARSIVSHPVETAKAVGEEAGTEAKQAVTHPIETAKETGRATEAMLTNPEAQETAKARFNQPGLSNKISGATEYLESGVPILGSGLVKSEEQSGAGNVAGALGTLAGTAIQAANPEEAPEAAAAETAAKEAATPHISFEQAGGKELRGPTTFGRTGGKFGQAVDAAYDVARKQAARNLEIKAEGPDWDRVHSAYIDGKKVGSVGYKVDSGGHAQIYGAITSPEWRGKGVVGPAVYDSIIREADARGDVSRLTSDSTGTSKAAGRVWEKMRDAGHPVENITHPNGKPGYQIDFENPPAPKEPVDPKFEQALARRGELPNQRVNLAPAYGDTGKYVGGLAEPKSKTPAQTENLQNDAVGFINPQGGFEKFNQLHGDDIGHEATHADFANNRNLDIHDMERDGWVRKAGQGAYEVGKLNPQTTAAIEKDILQDYHDLKTGGTGQAGRAKYSPAREIVVDTAKKSYTIPVDDFVEKYNGDLKKAIRGLDSQESNISEKANPTIAESAQKFNAAQGKPPIEHGQIDLPSAEERNKLADMYEEAGHAPNAPGVKRAYDAMKQETKAQFNHAVNDLGIKYDFTDKDPYDSAENMMKDLRENKHLSVYSGSPVQADHPLAEVDKETGQPYNNLFRAVHDTFGHAAGGNDFTEEGEHNAYNAHVQMYSPEARPAVMNETRNQTNWLFNNKGYREGTQPWRFADQKAIVLPEPKNAPAADVTQSVMSTAHAFGDRPFTSNDAKLYSHVNDQKEINAAIEHLVNTGQLKQIDATHYQANVPEPSAWTEAAAKQAEKNPAGAIDPKTGQSDTKGIGTEIFPEARQALDHPPTKEDFAAFEKKNAGILAQYPELRVGWDNGSNLPGGHEINIGAVGEGAARVAKKLDQRAAYDIEKQEEIDTGGKGLRSQFPNYSMEDRMKDLRNQPLSDIKNFEHISQPVYDNLEPDEREYLKGNKTLQRNVMAQYHKIEPSVNETSNAMQAGAALGGWWQRYIDIFHGLADKGAEDANIIGPSHAEILKQWHAAVSGNKSVEDANNLAWHSYADWLDAGKPTDRKSIDQIVRQNAAQPAGSAKKGNAAISDTLTRTGKVKSAGLDTSKLYNLVNSPEMKGERPFSGDVFLDDPKNPLMGSSEGARKIPSMGATVAGKGNLNRLVIDAHIRDFFGHTNSGGPAAQYIADSVHLRQAAKDLGLKGGEGQEQLWGTVLGLKQLLKQGLTPEEAAGTLTAEVINGIGKDYAEVIANDPEITKPGGVLDRLKDKYGIGGGSAGFSKAYSKASGSRSGEAGPAVSKTPVSAPRLTQTAQRIVGSIDPSKIKKPESEESQTAFPFGHNEPSDVPAASPKKKSGKFTAMDLLRGIEALKNPAKK